MTTVLIYPCTPGSHKYLEITLCAHRYIANFLQYFYHQKCMRLVYKVSNCSTFTFMVSGWGNIHTVELSLLLWTGNKDVDRKELQFNVYWTAWQWPHLYKFLSLPAEKSHTGQYQVYHIWNYCSTVMSRLLWPLSFGKAKEVTPLLKVYCMVTSIVYREFNWKPNPETQQT
jgi:hypothetical protein